MGYVNVNRKQPESGPKGFYDVISVGEGIVDTQTLGEVIYEGLRPGMNPPLRVEPGYIIPIDDNYILGPIVDYHTAPYWATNYNYQNDIQPSSWNSVNNLEICTKFKMNSSPYVLEELFDLCGVLTPDLEVGDKLGFWDSTNNQYWLEYPFNINTWYWLKVYYDKATYTQTWSLSTDGSNFTNIGIHTEDRNSDFEYQWDSTSTSAAGRLLLGTLNPNAQPRPMTSGIIDLKETYMKVNGITQCQYSDGTPNIVYYDAFANNNQNNNNLDDPDVYDEIADSDEERIQEI